MSSGYSGHAVHQQWFYSWCLFALAWKYSNDICLFFIGCKNKPPHHSPIVNWIPLWLMRWVSALWLGADRSHWISNEHKAQINDLCSRAGPSHVIVYYDKHAVHGTAIMMMFLGQKYASNGIKFHVLCPNALEMIITWIETIGSLTQHYHWAAEASTIY